MHRKALSLALGTAMVLTMFQGQALAEEGEVSIGEAVFPDAKFLAYVQTLPGADDGSFTAAELAAITELNCAEMEIADLTGVEIFTELTVLNCADNQLTGLDVSQNTKLEELYCHYNQLAVLDVSHNPKLKKLNCMDNRLACLDLTANRNLTDPHADENIHLTDSRTPDLPGLDVKRVSELSGGHVDSDTLCFDEGSTSMTYTYDMGNGHSETFTVCYEGPPVPEPEPTATIDAAAFPDAKFLAYVQTLPGADDESFTAAELAAITELNCAEMEIADLTGVEIFTELTVLNCADNQLTGLDVSQNTKLEELYCGHNQLTEVVVPPDSPIAAQLSRDWQDDSKQHWHIGQNDAAAHTWGDWIVVQEPSDTAEGVRIHYCTACGHEETESIPAVPKPVITISGTVISAGEGAVTIQLFAVDADTPSYTHTASDGQYAIRDIEAGTYTMKVSKEHHVSRTYEIVAGAENVTQDVEICLLGDVNGDGKIAANDWNILYKHINKISGLEGYRFACADLDSDGKLMANDWNRLYKHINKIETLW